MSCVPTDQPSLSSLLVLVVSPALTLGCSVRRTAGGRGGDPCCTPAAKGGSAVVVNGGQHDVKTAMSTMQLVESSGAEEKKKAFHPLTLGLVFHTRRWITELN